MEDSSRADRASALSGGVSLRGDGKRLSDRLATEIARRIVWGELHPDEQLPTEDEIAEGFEVSRSVVRDAIQALSTLGLVDVKQGRGMRVSTPSAGAFGEALIILLMRSELTMGDILEARATIETQLAPLAAVRGTDEDWGDLERHLEAFAAAVDGGRWEEAEQEHLQFHGGIIRALHLPALEMMLEPLHQVILLSSTPPQIDDPDLWEVWAHRPILDALRSRSADDARQNMSTHFQALTGPPYAKLKDTRFRESEAARRIFNDLIKQDRRGRTKRVVPRSLARP